MINKKTSTTCKQTTVQHVTTVLLARFAPGWFGCEIVIFFSVIACNKQGIDMKKRSNQKLAKAPIINQTEFVFGKGSNLSNPSWDNVELISTLKGCNVSISSIIFTTDITLSNRTATNRTLSSHSLARYLNNMVNKLLLVL